MENFIEDILNQLIEDAMKIKNNTNDDFDKGKLLGYYEIISKILNQAEAFNVFDKLSPKLKNFVPEDLLGDGNFKI